MSYFNTDIKQKISGKANAILGTGTLSTISANIQFLASDIDTSQQFVQDIDGVTMTFAGNNAQPYYILKNIQTNGITEYKIPEGVVLISCLLSPNHSITIPKTVTYCSFQHSNISTYSDKVHIKNHIKYYPSNNNPYFYVLDVDDSSLTNYIIDDNTKIIGDNAFIHCQAWQNAFIPNSVIHIGSNCFDVVKKSLSLPPNLITLGKISNRFLTELKIPTNLKCYSGTSIDTSQIEKLWISIDVLNSLPMAGIGVDKLKELYLYGDDTALLEKAGCTVLLYMYPNLKLYINDKLYNLGYPSGSIYYIPSSWFNANGTTKEEYKWKVLVIAIMTLLRCGFEMINDDGLLTTTKFINIMNNALSSFNIFPVWYLDETVIVNPQTDSSAILAALPNVILNEKDGQYYLPSSVNQYSHLIYKS